MFLPRTSDRVGVKVTVYGRGGVSHVLTDYSGAGKHMLLSESLKGFGMPEFEHFSTTHVGVHGAQWRGWNVKPREIVLPVLVSSTKDDGTRVGFTESVNDFWNVFRPDEDHVLEVETPGGSTRRIDCRLGSVDDSMTMDPVNRGYIVYMVHLTAFDPFWRGGTESISWFNDDLRDWLGGGPVEGPGTAFPVVISPGGSGGESRLLNHGDVDAWPTWTLSGPISRATVTVNGGVFAISRPIGEGDVLRISTHPKKQEAILNGSRDWLPYFDEWDFAPIKPGMGANVIVDFNGEGSVVGSVTPRFLRAW